MVFFTIQDNFFIHLRIILRNPIAKTFFLEYNMVCIFILHSEVPRKGTALIMRIIPGFIIREIAGETIVVPTGEASRKLSGIITLNECARFLFELLQTERTEEDLTAALLDEYEITPSQAAEDVAEFVSQLRQKGFLTDNQSN